jgi:hypothetical protein
MKVRSSTERKFLSLLAYQVHVFDHDGKFPAVVAAGEDFCWYPEFFGFESDFNAVPLDVLEGKYNFVPRLVF